MSAAALLLALTALTGCGGPVEVTDPELSDADARACQDLSDALPESINDEERRETDPADARTAAYGDPAIVITCGVTLPPTVDSGSVCEDANGVGWSAPAEQYDDQSLDVTFYSVTDRPIVEVRIPADYRPSGPAAALAALGEPVQSSLTKLRSCF